MMFRTGLFGYPKPDDDRAKTRTFDDPSRPAVHGNLKFLIRETIALSELDLGNKRT